MRKTALLLLVAALLSGCAGFAPGTGIDARYPLCSVLPGGAIGCPSQSSQKGA